MRAADAAVDAPSATPRAWFGRPEVLLAAGAGAALFAYAAVRAWTLSFTHDESSTYTRFVGQSVGALVRYDEATANHHLLNTLAMKAADAAVGSSELALRAGSLAAGALYLVVVAAWSLELRSRLLGALALVLAAGNPFVLDFLSLARGYALGLAGVAAAALLAVRYAGRPSARGALAAAVAGGAAAVASFALLPFFVSLCAALVLFALPARRRQVPGSPRPEAVLAAVSGVALLVAAVAARPVLRLREEGQLYFGGESLRETLGSLVAGSLYGEWPSAVSLGAKVAVVVLGAAVLAASVRLALRGPIPPPSTMLALLVLLPVGLSVAQHHVLDTPYPHGRTALFLVPLGALWLCTVADELLGSLPSARRPLRAGAVTLVVVGALHVAATLNVSYTYDWRYDADTERIAHDLHAAGRARPDEPLSIGASWLFEPTLNFYRDVRGLTGFREVVRDCRVDCLAGDHDLYVAIGADVAVAQSRGGRLVRRYPTGGAVLLTARPARAP